MLYLSTHQYPYYPGTGHWSETGAGEGAGLQSTSRFLPTAPTQAYAAIYDRLWEPIVERFQPQFIFVSAGFDAHENDPLAMENLSSAGYVALASRIKRWADRFCEGNCVFVLEGGYDYQALGECVSGVLAVLDGADPPDAATAEVPASVDELLGRLTQLHGVA